MRLKGRCDLIFEEKIFIWKMKQTLCLGSEWAVSGIMNETRAAGTK